MREAKPQSLRGKLLAAARDNSRKLVVAPFNSVIENGRSATSMIVVLSHRTWLSAHRCRAVIVLRMANSLHHHHHNLQWVENMVSFAETTSKTIIILFVIDTLAHITAFGPKEYCSNKMYVLDGAIVLITFIVEFIVRPQIDIEHKEFGLEDEEEGGEGEGGGGEGNGEGHHHYFDRDRCRYPLPIFYHGTMRPPRSPLSRVQSTAPYDTVSV